MNLIIPENGTISLNIALTYSRLGSSSTRTTHPYYINLLQELLDNLDIKLKLRNPYQFLTKGEMIRNSNNIDFLKENIENTMSCSHPDVGRRQGLKEACHCGNCIPCVIRRAAIKKANIEDATVYRDDSFSGHKAKANLNAFLLAVIKYNPKKAILDIQTSGNINKDVVKYADLYNRSILELKGLLREFYEFV